MFKHKYVCIHEFSLPGPRSTGPKIRTSTLKDGHIIARLMYQKNKELKG